MPIAYYRTCDVKCLNYICPFLFSQDNLALNNIRIITTGAEFSSLVEACTPCLFNTN